MAKEMIPPANPKLRFERFQGELLNAFAQVLHSGSYILGNELEKFEKTFAAYVGSAHCIGVNSGTDALSLSLLSAGVQANDEVITTSISAPATIIAILNTGATPVIVDVEPPTWCISAKAVQAAITDRTRFILLVHLHGYASPMDELAEIARVQGISLIEDCAQSHGATHQGKKLGSIGVCGAFSFYPTKNLACMGDAGAITTDDPVLAKSLLEMRNYGFSRSKLVEKPGLNSRMDELQAAILNVLLPCLDDNNQRRAFYAREYHRVLKGYEELLPPLVPGAVYHQFPLRLKNRDKFQRELQERGIVSDIHYPDTMKSHPGFSKYCKEIPTAEAVVKEFVSLPIQPEILDRHFEEIATGVLSCLKNQ